MRRVERVVVLVWSLGDAVATPAGSREPRRLMPTRREVCPACDGERFVLDRFGRRRPCAGCGAEGRVWVDGYTGERTGAPGSVAPVALSPGLRLRVGCAWCQEAPRSRWDEARGTWLPLEGRFEVLPCGSGVRAGERCWACGGTGWRYVSPDGGAAGVGGSAQDSVAWRIRGSYPELVLALETLKAHDRRAYRALLGCAQAGRLPVSPAELRGAGRVAALMPPRIVVAAGVLEAWRAREERAAMIRGPRRNQRIRELLARGESAAAVARRAGLSERQVRRIAQRTDG